MPAWGYSPAGFTVKPLANILSDMQANVLANVNSQFDLSPGTPDGQMLGIIAAEYAALWELAQVAFNSYNRADVEGAGLDNLGDITGTPREGATYTQVYCTVTLAAGTYAASTWANGVLTAGVLVANVAGNQSFSFANVAQIVSTGAPVIALFQAATVGPTATVNDNTLNQITTPVTGWTAINNPSLGTSPNSSQAQVGAGAELDAAYALRQAQDVSGEGSCTAAATAAALNVLGAAQVPPVTLIATVLQNTTNGTVTTSGLVLPPHCYAPILYDGGVGWALSVEGQSVIAACIYANKPGGITSFGTTSVTVQDAYLGAQTISYTVPAGVPLYISATVVARPGFTWTNLKSSIWAALATAAIAPTPSTNVPPAGQLAPGSPVIGSQLEAVIVSVPGVLDVQALTFGFAPGPTNTMPIVTYASQVATIALATASTNIVLTQSAGP